MSFDGVLKYWKIFDVVEVNVKIDLIWDDMMDI